MLPSTTLRKQLFRHSGLGTSVKVVAAVCLYTRTPFYCYPAWLAHSSCLSGIKLVEEVEVLDLLEDNEISRSEMGKVGELLAGKDGRTCFSIVSAFFTSCLHDILGEHQRVAGADSKETALIVLLPVSF